MVSTIRCKKEKVFRISVADLGEGPGGPVPPPLILSKKRKKGLKGKRPTGQVYQDRPPPPPPSLAQGLGPPLNIWTNGAIFQTFWPTHCPESCALWKILSLYKILSFIQHTVSWKSHRRSRGCTGLRRIVRDLIPHPPIPFPDPCLTLLLARHRVFAQSFTASMGRDRVLSNPR